MVAGKDRLYRALDKALEHRDALMGHLQERWSELFGAECQLLLYDLTSTYFEGEAAGVPAAARGYSRDHRPDTLQVMASTSLGDNALRAGQAQVADLVEEVQQATGESVEVAFVDQGYTGEEPAEQAAKRGIRLIVVKLEEAKKGLSFCPGDGWLSVPSLGPSASAGSPKTMSGFPPRWQVYTGSRSLS